MKKKQIVAITMGILAIGTQGWAAQALEDHSEKAQELAAQPVSSQVDNQSATTANASSVSFQVARLSVDSEVPVPARIIRQATKGFEGRETVFSELNTVTDTLTKYVRSHGYPAAAAYIPAQASSDGVIVVKITAGRIGQIQVDDKSRLRESAVRTAIGRLKSGEIITTKDLETVLYTLNGTGGVKAVGVLSPGSAFGTSDITIQVREGKDDGVMLYTENYGSKAAGRYRMGLIYDRAQMNGTGDSMQISGLFSNENMHNYAIRYQTLAGHTDSMVGMAAGRMTYDLGDAFANLDATGKANTYSLFGKTPFYMTTNGGLALTYGADYRELEDNIKVYQYAVSKSSWNFHAGLEGYRRISKGLWSYDLSGYTGHLSMDSDTAKTINAMTNTGGEFAKGVANLKYQQGIDRHWDMVVKAQCQQASRNLDSSEQLYLGGISGVRAYPQGTGSGDRGYFGSLELRYHPSIKNLTMSTYFDGGHVDARKDKAYGDTGYTLKGWGIGLAYTQPADYFLRLDYARRIGYDEDLTDASAKDKGRFWFMAGKLW